MKTTVELPEELMRAVKIRAVNEGRRLKDVMADAIRRGLSQPPETVGAPQRKVRLPLVACSHDARSDEEMTPERIAEVLLEQESRDAVR